MRKWLWLVLVLAVPFLDARPASADTVDFSALVAPKPGDDLGVSTYVAGPITIDALYLSGATYISTGATIFVRNQTNDHGLGVCSPAEQSTNACASYPTHTGGGGDINELDNEGSAELIRLTRAEGYQWTEIGISSLDTAEQGQLWYSNTAGTAQDLSTFATLFGSFTAGNQPIEFTVALTGAARDAKYLYFVPGGPGSTSDNDYLVKSATVQAVPEPGTAGLLAAGLAFVVATAWLRRAPTRACCLVSWRRN